MSSVGDQTPDAWLRVVYSFMSAMALSFEEAVEQAHVPADLRDAVRAIHDHDGTVQITRVRGVVDGGPKAWASEWDSASGSYWIRQRQYLLDKVGRRLSEVEATDDDSTKILSYLEDPRASGPDTFDVRGLVIGNVQSGKTANFSAVIAKAADLGYRVVIVLSGIHNSLRQQTQRRLERELGLSDVQPGVGRPEAGRRWNNPTTADLNGDFNPGTADPSILQGNENVIFIVKKWHTVLARLLEFIQEGKPPASLPVLIIDDEADQASIDTSSPGKKGDTSGVQANELVDPAEPGVDVADEIDPSKTNGLIRQIIAQFARVSYIGYTATPFANVLIDPDAAHGVAGADLYPKDFILTLFPRPGYVGATRLFGHDAIDGNPEGAQPGLDVIRTIPEAEVGLVTPVGVKAADFVPSVPPSLRAALQDWLLATGARLVRAGTDIPSALLIHVHQWTDIQNALAPQVEALLVELREDWRYDPDGPLRALLRTRWDEEFRSVTRRIDAGRDMEFPLVEQAITSWLRDKPLVLALNSDTDDALDYERDPNLKAVIIGGNKLSRGMTVEGLTVSYYVRETAYMDTLLQMARWFGYREGYVDLTRLYTTENLAAWFRDVALVDEELRAQVMQAELDRVPPREVGYRLRSHPAMMVTAQNKMGAWRMENLSFAGRMIQTSRFRLDDPEWLQANLAAARRFLGSLGSPESEPSTDWFWSGVPWEAVVGFLSEYESVQSRTSFDASAAARYVRAQVAHGELTTWDVAISTRRKEDKGLGSEDMGVEGGLRVPCQSRTRLKIDRSSIGVLTNPASAAGPTRQGDEEIGLSDRQIENARHLKADGQFERIRDALLAQRDVSTGLLVLYPISRFSVPQTEGGDRVALFPTGVEACTVVGAALAFPPSNSAATIEYIATGGDG